MSSSLQSPASAAASAGGPSSTYDVVVVGAGPIGLACAWQLAEHDLTVAVLDPSPGSGASAVAAGMLAPVTEVAYGEEELLAASLLAAARYPSFVAELEERAGQPVGYRTTGTLAVALDPNDLVALRRLHDFQRSLGLPADVLTSRECRHLEPLLTPAVAGGMLASGDHQVDPRRLTAALLVAAERAGAHVVRRRVRAVASAPDNRDGRVDGVVLDDGSRLGAGTVVLAAGCWSPQVEGIGAHVLPPIRPVKGQVLRLTVPAAARPFLDRTVRATVHGFHVYLVPREDGELVVGATQEEKGYDEVVTAGAVHQLLRDACELVPGLAELPLVEARAGLRPGSPDNAPLVGPSQRDGLVLATGHHRNGILLTPVTADAVVDLITTGAMGEHMRPFTPDRFHAPPDRARASVAGAIEGVVR